MRGRTGGAPVSIYSTADHRLSRRKEEDENSRLTTLATRSPGCAVETVLGSVQRRDISNRRTYQSMSATEANSSNAAAT